MKRLIAILMHACSLPTLAADKTEDVLKTLRSPGPAPVKTYTRSNQIR